MSSHLQRFPLRSWTETPIEFPDVDECANPGVCGQNALCQNLIGNYTCVCPQGFIGNPYDGCIDVDECDIPNQCAPGAICRNVVGGRECFCPPGYDGDPYTLGCTDMDECSRNNPCGRNAHCSNIEGSFKCSCPPGFIGDPLTECSGISSTYLINQCTYCKSTETSKWRLIFLYNTSWGHLVHHVMYITITPRSVIHVGTNV